MKIHKLGGTDAFVVFDLDDATRSLGVVRLAPKILVDGATLLARSVTYTFASFAQQVGGASGGINARPDGRAEALTTFTDELAPLVAAGTFAALPGKGVSPADVAELGPVGPWVALSVDQRAELLAASVTEAADVVAGGLEGRTVALEGLDASSAPLIAALAARGARVVAAATVKGTVVATDGLDADALIAALAAGPDGLGSLGAEVQPASAVFGVAADVLVAGSKAGVIDDTVAADVLARAVVPAGPVPVTAKALAQLGRQGVAVLPDFVTTAGPLLATVGAVPAEVSAVAGAVRPVLDEVLGHARGPVLGACFRAEDFLRTWQAQLPFGRPIA